MDGLLTSNFKKAQELLKEAGYDGTPVVLMHSPDPRKGPHGVVRHVASQQSRIAADGMAEPAGDVDAAAEGGDPFLGRRGVGTPGRDKQREEHR